MRARELGDARRRPANGRLLLARGARAVGWLLENACEGNIAVLVRDADLWISVEAGAAVRPDQTVGGFRRKRLSRSRRFASADVNAGGRPNDWTGSTAGAYLRGTFAAS